jgi:hypothetical protein
MSNITLIKKEIEKTALIPYLLRYIEIHFVGNWFDGLPKLNKQSIFDCLSKIETNNGGQITGKVSVQLSDSFARCLVYYGNIYLESIGSNLRIIPRDEILIQESREFDICFEMYGHQELFEIKFSQGENKTQGATHGNKKVDNFIIIESKFDMDRIITENNVGILGKVWIGFTKNKPKFKGDPKSNSSRTHFSYSYEEYPIQDMEECVIFGSFEKKRKGSKYYRLIRKSLYE